MVAIALIIALDGFLMGFDTSVISGVVEFIEIEFSLTSLQLGWSVSSLTLSATMAMLAAGPLSDRIGRLHVLRISAVLFGISAIVSAAAPNFTILVLARMLGGLGVGASLITAPMLIAEMAPASSRGKLVSFNQFNIVIGISLAFFSNYLILVLGQSDANWVESLKLNEWAWRWMLGIEMIPAIFYYLALNLVPESPRWLVLQGREGEAFSVLVRINGNEQAEIELDRIRKNLFQEKNREEASWRMLFTSSLKLVLLIGVSIGILQQITGINAVFYYAPMIFEQSGIGTDAAFMQAVLVGVINVIFTVLAMALIDRIGRKSLLVVGLSGITFFMGLLSYGFGSATYSLDIQGLVNLPAALEILNTSGIQGIVFDSDVEYRQAMVAILGSEQYSQHQSILISEAISVQPGLILIGILGFVASFAVSLGPVMWVLFSELFPNRIRGKAISFAGLINSSIAFLVTFAFPWELENLGNATTFLIYAVFAFAGLAMVIKILPETKGKTLEQIEGELVGS